jgi:hypothetical protein
MTFGLYILFNLVILLFFGIWIRRLIVRRLEPERILADLEGEVQEVIQSLNAAGDQNISLLEDRIDSLKALLRHADTQIEELESQLATHRRAREEIEAWEAQSESSGEQPLTLSLRKNDAGDSDTEATATEEAGSEDGAGHQRPDGVEREIVRADIPGSRPSDPMRPEPVEMTPREQVLYLHIQGHSSEEIAMQTGIAVGEVELIISLGTRKQKRS